MERGREVSELRTWRCRLLKLRKTRKCHCVAAKNTKGTMKETELKQAQSFILFLAVCCRGRWSFRRHPAGVNEHSDAVKRCDNCVQSTTDEKISRPLWQALIISREKYFIKEPLSSYNWIIFDLITLNISDNYLQPSDIYLFHWYFILLGLLEITISCAHISVTSYFFPSEAAILGPRGERSVPLISVKNK